VHCLTAVYTVRTVFLPITVNLRFVLVCYRRIQQVAADVLLGPRAILHENMPAHIFLITARRQLAAITIQDELHSDSGIKENEGFSFEWCGEEITRCRPQRGTTSQLICCQSCADKKMLSVCQPVVCA
jgi:hypothetical protein